MKKLFILMICMILLLGSVSAFELKDLDDVKRYDEETKTYTLKNFFGLGKTIADLELNTPMEFKVPIGYGKVFEVEIRNGEFDYEDIIDGIYLYNTKDGMREIIRNIDYKYKTIVQVPKYERVCDKNVLENKVNTNCRQEQTGLQDKVEWKDFTENSLLKGETITLGGFTDVKEGDRVEWILDIYGKTLNKWAVWTADLNIGLESYYKFQETSGGVIDSVGVNNLTFGGTGTRGVEGIIENAFSFPASNLNQIISAFSFDFTSAYSFCMWANTTDTGNFRTLVQDDSSGNFLIRKTDTNKFQIQTTTTLTGTTDINTGASFFLCMTYDGSSAASVYVNAINEV